MKHFTTLLFSFRGRIGRIAFCVTWLIAMALFFGPIVLAQFMGVVDDPQMQKSALGTAILIVVLIGCGLSVWMQICAYVKRFHDFGWAGIAAVLGFIPIVALLAILGLMLRPGTAEANEFGEPPTGLFDIGRPAAMN